MKKEINIVNEGFEENMERSFGEGAVIRGDKGRSVGVEVQPTGIYSLDYVLGGGIPKGKIVEIFGPAGCGKTTLAVQMISNMQKMLPDANALFIDTEHALNMEYCNSLGIDMKRFFIAQPASAEEALEMVGHVAQKNFVSFVVLDSVAALVPKSEVDLNITDTTAVASLARVMSNSLKRMLAMMSGKTSVYVLFINQLRSNVTTFGGFGGASEITAGGKALEYFAYMRIEMKKIGTIKQAEKDVGFQVRFRTVKNKMAVPFKQAVVEMYFGKGFSFASDILNVALEKNIIERKGIWYCFKNENFGKGKEHAISVLEQNSRLCNEVMEGIVNGNRSA